MQRELLIEDAIVGEEVAFVIQRGMRQPAHKVQAILDGNDHRTALQGHLAPIIAGGLAIDIASAVDPEDDGQLPLILFLILLMAAKVWCEHIEIETVFVVVRRAGKDTKRLDLGADRSVGSCLLNA